MIQWYCNDMKNTSQTKPNIKREVIERWLDILAKAGYPAGTIVRRSRVQHLKLVNPDAPKPGFFKFFHHNSLRGMFIVPEPHQYNVVDKVVRGRKPMAAKFTPKPDTDQVVVFPKKFDAPTVSPNITMNNSTPATAPAATSTASIVSYIPEKDPLFVPFGIYTDLKSVLTSEMFYPVFIYGLSGNGKTFTPEQICAEARREIIRVPVTIETDESDLLGGYKLIDGNTVWEDGPAVVAMERGAVLLLDEIDKASNKIMCLQPVLEGKPLLIKKTGRMVYPKQGFTVIATANTKGQGDADGKFITSNVLDEAFLERFAITLEQEYPLASVEIKILEKALAVYGLNNSHFALKLTDWANTIRKTYAEGACDQTMSTRRLVHIVNAFAIFGQDRTKAITVCLNRFDIQTRSTFLELYTKIDETLNPPAAPRCAPPPASNDPDDRPF